MSLSKTLVRRICIRAPQTAFRQHARPCLVRSPLAHPTLLRQGGRWDSTSMSQGPPQPKFYWLRRGAVLTLKLIFLWVPAMAAWLAVVSGVQLDFRTPEEVKHEEEEAQRLERFFDVEHLSEVEYAAEWAAKEQALAGIVEKLIRSRTLQESMESANRLEGSSFSSQEAGDTDQVMEFSYVHPPAEADRLNSLGAEIASEGYRPWNPRLVLSHKTGSVALVTMRFQHVQAAHGRSETWACTKLRVELITGLHGEAMEEPLCDLQGTSTYPDNCTGDDRRPSGGARPFAARFLQGAGRLAAPPRRY
ncbi:unnamed protein product [Durusdinium trenchii]|uniref:Uncharacterized protein n=1 Tax=Durusdinium trenchii TaxID=1381693 RepID=A0ABP0Q038_9DINO